MRILRDFEGTAIRLTDERLEHILSHPELSGLAASIGEVLGNPEMVVQSRTDPEARLYYRYYIGTAVGDKFLCVVVKLIEADAFVVTGYLTDRVKKGKQLWPTEP
jgi:hypothetical protein